MLKTLAGRCLIEAPGGIKVYQNYLYRWLTINSDIIQTLIHRRHPEKASLDYISPLTLGARTEPDDCCLLGLGGAGVPHHLTPYIGTSGIIAVENNIEIINIAKTHFMTSRLKKLSIVHQDANEFVQNHTILFKHLIVDLYNSKSFPSECNNHDFIINCKKLLLPQGILAMNLTHLHSNHDLFEWVRKVFFGNTVLFPVKNSTNMVLMAFNESKSRNLLVRINKIIPIKHVHWDARWGCMAKPYEI